MEFQGLLIHQVLEMINNTVDVPATLREANISVILKKGKQPVDFTPYRVIALLSVDLEFCFCLKTLLLA